MEKRLRSDEKLGGGNWDYLVKRMTLRTSETEGRREPFEGAEFQRRTETGSIRD